MRYNIKNKKIIITGASSGIGERISWNIAKQGGVPILLARSIDKLEQIRYKIKQELEVDVFIYQVDLIDHSQLASVFHTILTEHGTIDGLINNAGIGRFDYTNDLDWTDVEHMVSLNVFSLIKGTKELLPHFLARVEGVFHIVNIGSQAGKITTPKSSVYAATKHAVIGFTNALRLELNTTGIYVTTVNLGPVRTNFFDTADPGGNYQKNVEKYMLDPDYVAQKIVATLFKNKRELNLPWWMEFGSKIYYLFPRLMERILRNQFNKK